MNPGPGRAEPRPASPLGDPTQETRRADFACAYAVQIAAGDQRSSEQWARAAWEGAPKGMRRLMLVGWRAVLGLRLGPLSAPDHILGWRVVETGPDATVCQLRSWFLNAYNTFIKDDGRLVWSTFVFYERPPARLIWPLVSLLHRPLVRIALRRASTMLTPG